MAEPREVDAFESVAITARRITTLFKEPDDDWEPMAFFDTEEGLAVFPLGPFMADGGMKDALANNLLPAMIKETKAVSVIMVLSVWGVDLSKGEDPLAVAPSQHPKRYEMVLISETTAEGVGRTAFAKIIRHENSPPTLGEWEDKEADAYTGRFVEPLVKALKEASLGT